jgi:hypothetical protein
MVSIRSASLQPLLPEQWSQHKEDCIELVGISIQRKKRAIGR